MKIALSAMGSGGGAQHDGTAVHSRQCAPYTRGGSLALLAAASWSRSAYTLVRNGAAFIRVHAAVREELTPDRMRRGIE